MAKKQEQTASFMVRFNQQIFVENGESEVQWRGKITHVQDGDEKRFTDFNKALNFMQHKLGELTEEATKHQSEKDKENIFEKSFSMWKTIKNVGPKVLRETLKDPKKQLHLIQEEIQDKFNNIGEEISEKVQIDQWRNASRSDFNKIQDQIASLTNEIKSLTEKIDELNKS